jgi:hypothetical protein
MIQLSSGLDGDDGDRVGIPSIFFHFLSIHPPPFVRRLEARGHEVVVKATTWDRQSRNGLKGYRIP